MQDDNQEDSPVHQWLMPTTEVGVKQKYVAAYRLPKLHQALVILGKRETRRLKEARAKGLYDGNTTIVPETIIRTALLKPSAFTMLKVAELKQIYEELVKENYNEKKYMDIKG
jgi:hypothetical protein